MKLEVLKKMIKDSVKEAISESIKDILLEALKKDNTSSSQINENVSSVKETQPQPEFNRESFRNQFANMVQNGEVSLNSSQVGKPLHITSTNTANGSLPEGEVSMDMINQFIK